MPSIQENAVNLVAHYQKEHVHIRDMNINEPMVNIIIGPEGDFSNSELEMFKSIGFQFVNLSHNRLRTETAAIVALSYLVE